MMDLSDWAVLRIDQSAPATMSEVATAATIYIEVLFVIYVTKFVVIIIVTGFSVLASSSLEAGRGISPGAGCLMSAKPVWVNMQNKHAEKAASVFSLACLWLCGCLRRWACCLQNARLPCVLVVRAFCAYAALVYELASA